MGDRGVSPEQRTGSTPGAEAEKMTVWVAHPGLLEQLQGNDCFWTGKTKEVVPCRRKSFIQEH